MWDWLVAAACSFDDTVAATLGWSRAAYAIANAVVTGALAWGFLATWLFAFGRLRRAGLARRQQRLVWWFAFAIAIVQIALLFLDAEGIAPVPCPWSSLLLPAIAFLFLLMAYGFHVQDENRASGARFIGMVAIPLLGEVAITAKATVSGAMRILAWMVGQV